MVDDSYTKLLLHGDGDDGSTTITDEAGHTMTAVNQAQIDTAQQKFGTGSILFDGTGDGLTIPDSADWNFGTGDFTIDFWYMQNSAVEYAVWYYQGVDGNNLVIFHTGAGSLKPRFVILSGGNIKALYAATNNQTFTADTWYHIALVRNGANVYIFKDGVSLALTVTQAIGTNSSPDLAAGVEIGNAVTYNAPLNGAIDEYRVSKGIARWTSNFTPPTNAYAPLIISHNLLSLGVGK